MRQRLLVAAIVIVVALGLTVAACTSDSATPDGTTPSIAETPDAAVTPEVTPEESDEDSTVDGDADDDPDAALRAEAEALCPAEFLEPCAESYIEFAKGSLEAALCIFPEGKWAMVTPEGHIGDSCGTPPDIGVIAAIVGGQE